MKRRSLVGFFLLLAFVILFGGTALQSQRDDRLSLRAELVLLQLRANELERLRGENQRLRNQQISSAEMEILRADHAALPGLRAEMKALHTDKSAVGP